MSRTFKIAAALIAASLAFAPAALAQTHANGIENVSIRVAYGDLDMSKPAGGIALLKRIEVAARKVCGEVRGRTPLRPHPPVNCRRETVARTVSSLSIGTLTLAWSGKYPTTSVASR